MALMLILSFAIYHLLPTGLPLARKASLTHDQVTARVIAYAEHAVAGGCPYAWGGNGPCSSGYDCSGLVMQAFRTAGITFGSSRPTAAVEWAYGPRVSAPRRGELVFFSGVDGTPQAPGHVGIVLGHDMMIDAYGAGTVVRVESFGLASSAQGLQYPIGYTDPG